MTETVLDYIAPTLRELAVPIHTLKADPENARKRTDRNLAAIRASYLRFGQRVPLVVNRNTMTVEAGNGRLRVIEELGWSHAAVVLCDDDEIAARAYAIADNRSSELATWDFDVLDSQLRSLAESIDVVDLGFSASDLVELPAFGDAVDPLNPDDIQPYSPEIEVFTVKVLGVSSDDREVVRQAVATALASMGMNYEVAVV